MAPPGVIMQKMQIVLIFLNINSQVDSGGSLIHAHMDNLCHKIRAKKPGCLPGVYYHGV
jgi:hypothetical protein